MSSRDGFGARANWQSLDTVARIGNDAMSCSDPDRISLIQTGSDDVQQRFAYLNSPRLADVGPQMAALCPQST